MGLETTSMIWGFGCTERMLNRTVLLQTGLLLRVLHLLLELIATRVARLDFGPQTWSC